MSKQLIPESLHEQLIYKNQLLWFNLEPIAPAAKLVIYQSSKTSPENKIHTYFFKWSYQLLRS